MKRTKDSRDRLDPYYVKSGLCENCGELTTFKGDKNWNCGECKYLINPFHHIMLIKRDKITVKLNAKG